MKYLNVILFAAILLVSGSCKKQDNAVNKNGVPNHLALNEPQTFDISGERVTCLLDGIIEDSRCPLGAECIWQGIAIARFKVTLENTQKTITLATFKFGEYDTSTVVSGFKIELVDISPYPDLNKPSNQSTSAAEVKITKL